MQTVYILDAVRTAIGNLGGALAPLSSPELAQPLMASLLERNRLEGVQVDDVILGNVLQAGQGQNVARQAAMGAGIPQENTALTINMVCGSGLRSIALGAQALRCGDANLVLAGGTEHMSSAPYLLAQARTGYRLGDGQLIDSLVHDGLTDIFNNCHMGITAENIAEQYGISREEQDAFAAASQNKAEAAQASGRFDEEIIPVSIPQRKKDLLIFARDEFPRAGTTVESLGALHPAFKEDGTVTAGNASGINDGAACLLLASGEAVRNGNLNPMARIVSYAWHGVDPAIMGTGPVEAVRIALKRAGWALGEVDLIEVNEAFAAQAIAVGRDLDWDAERVNVNGGAIALGHPIGASGARIVVTLLHEMKKRNAKKGLATLCIGGGMGIALCVEQAS